VIKISTGFKPERVARFNSEIEFHRGSPGAGVLPVLDSQPVDLTGRSRGWLVMPVAVPVEEALGDEPLLESVVEAVAAYAMTLARLADEGVGHRDVKPDNLFERDGIWEIGDFGLVTFPGKPEVTAEVGRLGPLHFHAPEMLSSATTAQFGPADVHSLAKTLWCLAGGVRYPPPGHHRSDTPALNLRSMVPHPQVGPLQVLIQDATDPDPRSRPTMRQFATELEAWLDPVPLPEAAAPIAQAAEALLAVHAGSMDEASRRTVIFERRSEFDAALLNALEPIEEALTSAGFALDNGGMGGPKALVFGLDDYDRDAIYVSESCVTLAGPHGLRPWKQPDPIGPRFAELRFGFWSRAVGDNQIEVVAATTLTEHTGFDGDVHTLLWSEAATLEPGRSTAENWVAERVADLMARLDSGLRSLTDLISARTHAT
jgi:hypothetical protein